MAKAPTPGLDRKLAGEVTEADKGPHLNVTYNDTTFCLYLNRISAAEVGLLRAETGRGLNETLVLTRQGDIDVVAALIWLARRQAGEARLRYIEVAQEITYGDDVFFGKPDDEDEPSVEEPGDPEG